MPFLIDGEEVEVIETVASGVIVRRMLCYFDDEEYGPPELVPRVFDEAPTDKVAARIAELRLEEESLVTRIAMLEQKAREQAAALTRFDKWKNLAPALARIEDFLEGRITHYLTDNYGTLEIQEAQPGGGIPEDCKDWEKKTKLMTLFGLPGNDLQWRVNHYRDGSGSDCTTEPFKSRGDALARMQERVNAFAGLDGHKQAYLLNAAVKYGLTVPPALREVVGKMQISAREFMVDKARKELADVEAVLAKTKEEFSEVSK